jgi:hypothetical protein
MQSRFGSTALVKQVVRCRRASARSPAKAMTNDVSTRRRSYNGFADSAFSGKVFSARSGPHRLVSPRDNAISRHILHTIDSTIITNLLNALSRHDVSPSCAIHKSAHALRTGHAQHRKAVSRILTASHATFISEVRTVIVTPHHLQDLSPVAKKRSRIGRVTKLPNLRANLSNSLQNFMPNASDVYDDCSLTAPLTNVEHTENVDTQPTKTSFPSWRPCTRRMERPSDSSTLGTRHAVYHRTHTFLTESLRVGSPIDRRTISGLTALVQCQISDDSSLTTQYCRYQPIDKDIARASTRRTSVHQV